MGRRRTKGRAVRRERRNVPRGRVYVQASFNNTLITVTDTEGGVLAWRSAGQEYRGSRKSTPFAAQS
ncbi:MAG: small ribosomal subunit protein uS11, partial [Anaerolineae bacterium]